MEVDELELMVTDDEFQVEESIAEATEMKYSTNNINNDQKISYSSDANISSEGGDNPRDKKVINMDAVEVDAIENATENATENTTAAENIQEKKRLRTQRFGGVDHEQRHWSDRSRTRRSRKRDKDDEESFTRTKLLKHLYEPHALDPKILGREIAYRLEEKKTKLIQKVVNTLGGRFTWTLFEDTIDTQLNGGMLTADGKRRRTSGGVFLAHLRERVTKRELDEIFKEEKEHEKQHMKQKKRRRKKEVLDKSKAKVKNILDEKLSNEESLSMCEENTDIDKLSHLY